MLIINPNGSDNLSDRQLWNGNSTNNLKLNEIKYNYAYKIYKQMRENFWIPEKVDLTADVIDYVNLTPQERTAYNGILSYLTFLDSIQVMNLGNIKKKFTAPEAHLPLSEQISQEALHSQSYQFMIDTIIPQEDRSAVYDFWRTDKILSDRCKYIASFYQEYEDKKTEETYFISLIADYLLEGLFFFNGFNFYYNLASRQLMPGSSDMFRYINRDEVTHIKLFEKLIKEAMLVFPYSIDQIYELVDKSTQFEINWTNYICDNQILGMTEQSTENYSKYLSNLRLISIGLKPIYDPDIYKTNPYRHLEKFADTSSEGNTKSNFFEATVTSYIQSSGVKGWDEI
jgi:ribonucleoside-diphosphate reductase beta chain